jgi:acyl transferase domain-containing protein
LKQRLSRLSSNIAGGAIAGRPKLDRGAKLAFLVTGDGPPSRRMGRELYEANATFRTVVIRCAEILKPLLPVAITDLLYATAHHAHLMNQTAYAQPAAFVTAYALAELWKSWGIRPSALLGDGVGEYVAACVAGVFSVDDALRLLCERAQPVSYASPRIPLVSTKTGRVVSEEIASAAYWTRQLTEPVDFAAGIRTLREHGCGVYLEIGPNATLTKLGRRCLAGEAAVFLPSLNPPASEWQRMTESLGVLYECGAQIDWEEFHQSNPGCRVALPTYPFQRERYWPDPVKPPEGHDRALHPLLGRPLGELAQLPAAHVWQSELDLRRLPLLRDHQLCGKVIMPHGAYVEMALRAGEEMFGSSFSHVTELKLHDALVVPEQDRKIIQTVASIAPDGASFAVYSKDANGTASRDPWTLHATATLHSESPRPERPDSDPGTHHDSWDARR